MNVVYAAAALFMARDDGDYPPEPRTTRRLNGER